MTDGRQTDATDTRSFGLKEWVGVEVRGGLGGQPQRGGVGQGYR